MGPDWGWIIRFCWFIGWPYTKNDIYIQLTYKGRECSENLKGNVNTKYVKTVFAS